MYGLDKLFFFSCSNTKEYHINFKRDSPQLFPVAVPQGCSYTVIARLWESAGSFATRCAAITPSVCGAVVTVTVSLRYSSYSARNSHILLSSRGRIQDLTGGGGGGGRMYTTHVALYALDHGQMF